MCPATLDVLARIARHAESLVMLIQRPYRDDDRRTIEEAITHDVLALLAAANFGREGALNFERHEVCLDALLSIRALLQVGAGRLHPDELIMLCYQAELALAEYQIR